MMYLKLFLTLYQVLVFVLMLCILRAKKSGGTSAKNPREKFQQSQTYRTFLNREPPRALGSKEIPEVLRWLTCRTIVF